MKRAIIVLTILLVVSAAANVVFVWNFQVARISHIEAVRTQMFWLYGEISHAACTDTNDYVYFPEIREIRLAQTRYAAYGLSSALNGLSMHHNHRAGGTDFPIFNVRVILEQVLRFDDNPTDNLQVLADKILNLYENLEPNMPTRELFELVNETNRAINNHFGW